MMVLRMSSAIGVFDSGIGGLSVVRSIMQHLPNENIIYFGDLARIPYGTKSVAMINQLTSQSVQFLLDKKVKALVIACNTITAVAYQSVTNLAKNIPIIDVINSTCNFIANNTKYKKIGVIATNATVNSKAYSSKLKQLNPELEVIEVACNLLVPLIEEGLLNHLALKLITQEYLAPLQQNKIEALILGCTHYPLIKDTIAEILGDSIDIIDPAHYTSLDLQTTLNNNNSLDYNPQQQYNFYVTDNVNKFKEIGEKFLNYELLNVELVSLNK